MESKPFPGTPYTETPKELRKAKDCAYCGTGFFPNSGVHKFCSVECKTKNNQENGSMSANRQYARISGNWSRYFTRLIRRAHKRSNLTVEQLLQKLDEQEGRCALSGVPLTCLLELGVKTKTNASLDRIKAGADYTIDNVQLVCAAVNSWRGDTDLNEFIWFCKQITLVQEEKEKGSLCRT